MTGGLSPQLFEFFFSSGPALPRAVSALATRLNVAAAGESRAAVRLGLTAAELSRLLLCCRIEATDLTGLAAGFRIQAVARVHCRLSLSSRATSGHVLRGEIFAAGTAVVVPALFTIRVEELFTN